MKLTPEETPLETPLNRFIFGSKVLEGHKETNLLNQMIQPGHFYITEPFPARPC